MKATAFSILFFLITTTVAQPMDWSRHYLMGDLEDAMDLITIDKRGNILAKSDMHRFIVMSKESIDRCNTRLEIVQDRDFSMGAIIAKSDGETWVFSESNINVYSDGNYSAVDTIIELQRTKNTHYGMELGGGQMLLSVGDKLFIYFDGEWSDFPTPVETGNNIYPSFIDKNGNIWASSWRKGVFCYKDDAWVNYNKSNSNILCDDFSGPARLFVEDNYGHIITGSDGNHDTTRQSGLYKFNGRSWNSIDVPGHDNIDLQCIARDSIGAIWFGTRQGVFRQFDNQWYHYGPNDIEKNDAPKGYIRDVLVSPRNRVFFAMYHTGIYMLDQDEEFTCEDLIGFNITNPTSSSIWEAGTRQTIEWEAFGGKDTINLEYRIQDSAWKGLNDYSFGIAYPFRYSWLIPDGLNGRCQIRISDYHDTTKKAVSDYFKIFTEEENTGPIFVNIPDTIYAVKGRVMQWNVNTYDHEDDSVTIRYQSLPPWVREYENGLTIDPPEDANGVHIHIYATDVYGGSDSCTVFINPQLEVERIIGSLSNEQATVTIFRKKFFVDMDNLRYIEIYNMKGKLLNVHTSNSLRVRKCENLPNGTYNVRFVYNDRAVNVKVLNTN